MAKRGYGYVCLIATKFIIFSVAKVLRRFYTLIHIGILLSALVGFSLIGGFLFQLVESPRETTNIEAIRDSRKKTLQDIYLILQVPRQNEEKDFKVRLAKYEITFIQAIINGTLLINGTAVQLWTFTGSTYFCFTTFTQLGFGNMAPKSEVGRVITLIYAAFSIPVGAVVFADLGRRINTIITLGWSVAYNAVLKCREEANKPGDEIGLKTGTKFDNKTKHRQTVMGIIKGNARPSGVSNFSTNNPSIGPNIFSTNNPSIGTNIISTNNPSIGPNIFSTNNPSIGPNIFSTNNPSIGTNIFSTNNPSIGPNIFSTKNNPSIGTSIFSTNNNPSIGTNIFSTNNNPSIGTNIFSTNNNPSIGTNIFSTNNNPSIGTNIFSTNNNPSIGTVVDTNLNNCFREAKNVVGESSVLGRPATKVKVSPLRRFSTRGINVTTLLSASLSDTRRHPKRRWHPDPIHALPGKAASSRRRCHVTGLRAALGTSAFRLGPVLGCGFLLMEVTRWLLKRWLQWRAQLDRLTSSDDLTDEHKGA